MDAEGGIDGRRRGGRVGLGRSGVISSRLGYRCWVGGRETGAGQRREERGEFGATAAVPRLLWLLNSSWTRSQGPLGLEKQANRAPPATEQAVSSPATPHNQLINSRPLHYHARHRSDQGNARPQRELPLASCLLNGASCLLGASTLINSSHSCVDINQPVNRSSELD